MSSSKSRDIPKGFNSIDTLPKNSGEYVVALNNGGSWWSRFTKTGETNAKESIGFWQKLFPKHQHIKIIGWK